MHEIWLLDVGLALSRDLEIYTLSAVGWMRL